ncbi:MAG: hypothetical protein HPY71_14940, partial [Firmicutes bacterium]|nr:hypothetical protein [Bacillota bacterium]
MAIEVFRQQMGALASVDQLLFKAGPDMFHSAMDSFRNEVRGYIKAHDGGIPTEVTEFTIDLCSYLTRWNLQRPGDPDALTDEALEDEVSRNIELLREA